MWVVVAVGGCCWRGWWLCFSLPLGAMAFCAVERARGAPWRAARWHGRAVVGCGGSSPLGARLPPRRLTRRLTAVDTAARVGNPRGSNPGAGLYHGCCPSRVIVVGRHAFASSRKVRGGVGRVVHDHPCSEVHGVNPTGSPHPTQGRGTAMGTMGHGTPHSPAPLACLSERKRAVVSRRF